MTPEQDLYFRSLLSHNRFNQYAAEEFEYGRQDSFQFHCEAYEALGYRLPKEDWDAVYSAICKEFS